MLCASRSQWTDTVTLTHTVVLSRQLSAPQRHTHALTDSHTLTYSLINMYSQAHSHSSSYTLTSTRTQSPSHTLIHFHTHSHNSLTHTPSLTLTCTHSLSHTLRPAGSAECSVVGNLEPGPASPWGRRLCEPSQAPSSPNSSVSLDKLPPAEPRFSHVHSGDHDTLCRAVLNVR